MLHHNFGRKHAVNKKNENVKVSDRKKQFLLSLIWLLLIPVTYVLVLLANANPAFVERFYSTGIYKAISAVIPFQYFPLISFFEIIVILGTIAILVCLAVFIVRLFRDKEDRLWRILNVIRKILIILGIVYFLFYLTWGFNYSRQPYSEIANLPLEKSSKSELKELCVSLIEKTNESRARLGSNNDKTLGVKLSTSELQNITKEAYKKACEDSIPGIYSVLASPKPLNVSPLLSYTGITGIYIPYTAESNYNNDIPMPLKGSTICHELAHRQGFAREDEANFISYLVCTNARNDYLNYSGLLLATIHSMNKLYEDDKDSYYELYKLYSAEVDADLSKDRIYWDEHSGEVEKTVTRINDTYLKSNNLSDGVKSYGRMVDLLLAQQRAEG